MIVKLLKNRKVLFTVVGFLPLSISVVFTPIYVNYLSLNDYGFLNLFTTLLGLIAPALHLGIKDGFGFLYWKNTDNQQQTESFFRDSFSALLLVQLFTLMAFIFIGPFILRFSFNVFQTTNYYSFILIAGFYAFFINVNELLFYYYRNKGDIRNFVYLNIGALVLMTLGSFLGIFVLRLGLYGAILGKFGGYSLVVIYFIFRNVKKINWKPNLYFMKKIFFAGFPILISTILGAYASVCDKYFLQEHYPVSSIGIYGMALTIVYLADILLTSFMHYLLPDTLHKIKIKTEQAAIITPITEVLHLLALFACFVLGVTPLLLSFFPANYLEVLIYIPFLMIIPLLKFLYNFNALNFYLYQASRVFLKLQVITTCGTFLVTWFMPKFAYIFGAVGIAIFYNVLQLVVSYCFLIKERYFLLNDKKIMLYLGLAIGLFIATGLWYNYTHQKILFFMPLPIYTLAILSNDKVFFTNFIKRIQSTISVNA